MKAERRAKHRNCKCKRLYSSGCAVESNQRQDLQDARCDTANGHDAAEDGQTDGGGARGSARTDPQG
jgi:hypothetical protein